VVDRANARWPSRFHQGSVLALPFPDGYFDTVLSTDCMEHLAPDDVPTALRELYRVSSRYVFLQIATTHDRDGHWHLTVEDREWWEARCFEAGFRKHALYYRVNHYEALNNDGWQILVLLEKVPPEALKHYDLTVLVEERLLHTDMLREFGRRSDAHCIRYHKAAEFIRPGDTVLDVACGLGYGSHILYTASQARLLLGVDLSDFGVAYANAHYGCSDAVEFKVGDAQALDFIPDHSIDFIAAFETIEHVPDPVAYLRELKRVLKPSGRVMLCAPNDWTDETGKDPNPHHLHVYTWERLVAECGAQFLLESGFLQTAGGAMKCHHSPRKWEEVPVDRVPEQEAEWVLLLCMLDPVGSQDISYQETVWTLPQSPEFHVSAFARDYDNPWLVKGMVAMGMRARSHNLLVAMQERILKNKSPESVDYGAALCGRIYSTIQSGDSSADTCQGLEGSIRRYAAIANPSPHQLRWQVSLLFAGGELARKQGRFSDAAVFYSACSDIDVATYSPLLGNKVLDALHWLAVLSVSRHEISAARQYLLKAINEVRRLVTGSWLNISGEPETPLPFGLAEMAQLLDKASRAAYMLTVLDACDGKPASFHQQSTGFFERQLVARDCRLSELENTVENLITELLEKETGLQSFVSEVVIKDTKAQELAREVAAKDLQAQELAREVAAKDSQAQKLAREVAAKDSQAQKLAREVAGKDSQAQALAREVAAKDSQAQELAREVAAKDLQAQALAREVAGKDLQAQELAREVAAKDAQAQELACEVAAKDSQAQELACEVAAKDSQAQELACEVAAKDAQAQELAREIAAKDSQAGQLAEELKQARAEYKHLQDIIRKQDAILIYFRPRSWSTIIRSILSKSKS